MTQDYSTKWWAAFTCIAFLEAVLLMMLLSGQASIQLLIAIVIIAMLLFLIPRLDEVISLTFDRGKIDAKLSTLGKKVSTAKSRTDKFVLLSIPKSMYETLKKIDAGKFGQYKMTERLERELYHLRDIGYVEVERIRDIPYEGNNLSEFVMITDFGKQFLDLRESIEKDGNKD